MNLLNVSILANTFAADSDLQCSEGSKVSTEQGRVQVQGQGSDAHASSNLKTRRPGALWQPLQKSCHNGINRSSRRGGIERGAIVLLIKPTTTGIESSRADSSQEGDTQASCLMGELPDILTRMELRLRGQSHPLSGWQWSQPPYSHTSSCSTG